jgi:hypothetical protein
MAEPERQETVTIPVRQLLTVFAGVGWMGAETWDEVKAAKLLVYDEDGEYRPEFAWLGDEE